LQFSVQAASPETFGYTLVPVFHGLMIETRFSGEEVFGCEVPLATSELVKTVTPQILIIFGSISYAACTDRSFILFPCFHLKHLSVKIV
jgi:hypothetical protein